MRKKFQMEEFPDGAPDPVLIGTSLEVGPADCRQDIYCRRRQVAQKSDVRP